MVKNLPVKQETWVLTPGQEDPLEKKMATHSSFLLGKSHEQRSLAGYSPWSHKETDIAKQLNNNNRVDVRYGKPRVTALSEVELK